MENLIIRRADLLKQLDHVQAASKTRTLGESDVENFLSAYKKLRRQAREKGIQIKDIEIKMDGGAVTSSYRYPAESTLIHLRDGKLSVERGYAPKVAGGRYHPHLRGGIKGKGNGGVNQAL